MAGSRLDLNEMLVFVRVATAGSFTAAARILGMPKSTVSRKISALEQRIGARLIQRTTRRLRLTEAGHLYYDRCARIVSDVEEAESAVGQLQAAPRGLLRATVPLLSGILGETVAEFLQQYPDVRAEIVCTDRNVDLVAEGFDVALRAGALSDSTLIARKLGTLRAVLVASPAYLRRRGTPRAPRDLERHDAIIFGSAPNPTLWSLKSGERSVDVRVAARLQVNDIDWMHDAVRAGIGIALMPDFICRDDIETGRLRRVLGNWSSGETPFHVLYPSGRYLSPKVLAFVEMISKGFRVASRAPKRNRG